MSYASGVITAKGKKLEWHEGLTVEQVLKQLGYAVPAAQAVLNGRAVPRNEWASTSVPDDAVLDVKVMMAGG